MYIQVTWEDITNGPLRHYDTKGNQNVNFPTSAGTIIVSSDGMVQLPFPTGITITRWDAIDPVKSLLVAEFNAQSIILGPGHTLTAIYSHQGILTVDYATYPDQQLDAATLQLYNILGSILPLLNRLENPTGEKYRHPLANLVTMLNPNGTRVLAAQLIRQNPTRGEFSLSGNYNLVIKWRSRALQNKKRPLKFEITSDAPRVYKETIAHLDLIIAANE